MCRSTASTYSASVPSPTASTTPAAARDSARRPAPTDSRQRMAPAPPMSASDSEVLATIGARPGTIVVNHVAPEIQPNRPTTPSVAPAMQSRRPTIATRRAPPPSATASSGASAVGSACIRVSVSICARAKA